PSGPIRAYRSADGSPSSGGSSGSFEKKNDELIADPGDDLDGTALTLSDVMASVYRSFPMIQQARYENMIASGERQSAISSSFFFSKLPELHPMLGEPSAER
ncbi:MAG: hypothetical protein ACKN9U_25240, partial [Pirellulaceae bacterium]